MKPSIILHKLVALRQKQVEGYHPKPMDVSRAEEHTCVNCGTAYRGNFCPCCGQTASIARLTLRQGLNDVFNIFTNFDTGFFHTCLELYSRPGYMIRDYLNGKRQGYVKPMQMLFLTGTIRLFTDLALNGTREKESLGLQDSSTSDNFDEFYGMIEAFSQWLIDNMTVFFLIAVTLLVIPNYISFNLLRKDRTLNLAEHFFIMIYVGCQMIILDTLQLPLEKLTGELGSSISYCIPTIFTIIDYKQILGISTRRAIWHTLLSIVIMLVSLYVIVTIIGAIYYAKAVTQQ